MRRTLRQRVLTGWPVPTIAKTGADSISEEFQEFQLRSVSELKVQMPYGLDIHAYHFIQSEPSDRVALAILPGHPLAKEQGSRAGHPYNMGYFRRLLGLRVDVIATSLPTEGMNQPAAIDLPGHGAVSIDSIDDLIWLDQPNTLALGSIFGFR